MLQKVRFIVRRYNEAIFWSFAFVLIFFFVDPAAGQSSLCLFHRLGWENCFGCGLARSMHRALHGDFASSWQLHKMGIPAVLILGGRIVSLVISQKPSHDQLPAIAARSSA